MADEVTATAIHNVWTCLGCSRGNVNREKCHYCGREVPSNVGPRPHHACEGAQGCTNPVPAGKRHCRHHSPVPVPASSPPPFPAICTLEDCDEPAVGGIWCVAHGGTIPKSLLPLPAPVALICHANHCQRNVQESDSWYCAEHRDQDTGLPAPSTPKVNTPVESSPGRPLVVAESPLAFPGYRVLRDLRQTAMSMNAPITLSVTFTPAGEIIFETLSL